MVRAGSDVTVLAYGPMVRTALDAATAAAEDGRDLEVIDLRSLSPLDLGAVYESVLDRVEAAGYDVLGRRMGVRRWRLPLLVFGALRR